ncbi:MAG: hypothetical protein SGPRY_014414, partial [Prymnesium sp.]
MADSSQQDSPHPGEPGEAAIDIISGLEELQVATDIAEEDREPTPPEFQNNNDDTPSDVEDDPPPAAPPSAPPPAGSGGGDREYSERAANSELYRSYRHFHELDGRNQNNDPVKSYEGAAAIKYADMRYLDASVLLNGLDPAVNLDLMFENDRLAVKGHR